MKTIQTNNILLDISYLDDADGLEDYKELWRMAEEASDDIRWFKGEILDRIDTKYSESAMEEFAREMKVARSTLTSYRRTARAFKPEERTPNLTWSHYAIASQVDSYNKGENKFETEERHEWIKKAEENNWGARELGAQISKEKRIQNDGSTESDEYVEYVNRFKASLKKWDYKKLQKEDVDSVIAELQSLIRILEKRRQIFDGVQ